MDLSKVSLEDLQAYKKGDLSKVSTEGLQAISASMPVEPAAAPVDTRGAKIDAYLSDTDKLLNLAPGTSARQIYQESKFNSGAVNATSGAVGLAQMMPRTVRVMSQRVSRQLDPTNDDDSLLMHRMVMQENMQKFGNQNDALRAYNSGWDKSKWNNKETNGYISTISPSDSAAVGGFNAVPVRKGATMESLATDPNWIAASKVMYKFNKDKTFDGSDEEAASYGKGSIQWDSTNSLVFAYDAKEILTRGTPEVLNAVLYTLDQWDNVGTTVPSAAKGVLKSFTDPLNIASLGSLGMATAGKIAATQMAKTAFRQALLKALGRTGIQAGIMGGVQAATADATKQVIEVKGGKEKSFDYSRLAGNAAVGVASGVALGTAGDALLTVAAPMVKATVAKIANVLGSGEKVVAAEAGKVVPVAIKDAEAAVAGKEPIALKEAPNAEPIPAQGLAPEASPVPHTAPTEAPVDKAVALPRGPGDTLPVTSILTRDEVEAITTREQKGRKWTDDLPRDNHPGDARALLKLEIPDLVHGLRDTVTNQVDLITKARTVADQLKGLTTKELDSTLEIAREAAWTGGQTKVMSMAGQILHQNIKEEELALQKLVAASPDSPKMAGWLQQLADLDTRKIPIGLYDEAQGSFAGSLTRQRQSLYNELRGSSIESLMKEHSVTRAEATRLWEDVVVSGDKSAEAKLIVAKADLAIEKALATNDHVAVFKIQQQKMVDLAKVAESMAPDGGNFFRSLQMRAGSMLHSFAGGVKETMISFVFTPPTLMMNATMPLVKTLALPLVKYIVTNPLEKANLVEMSAHYAAMRGTMREAWGGVKAAHLYEQSILTRDNGRMLEGEMVVKGKIGGLIRFLPRILNASDEFLSQVNYTGFVAAHAAGSSYLEGKASGLAGSALDTFVKDAISTAKKGMYEEADSELLRPIVNKGVNLGYEGEKLTAYVTEQAGKSGMLDALRHGTDKVALDSVRDMLYKKRFSGDGAVSNGAKTIETFMTRHPAISVLTGQLFFRTPVRVFEEGIRMTPGVQFLAPNFMKDLYGANGIQRQVRAQGEALTGLAITGAVISMYAQGKITGDGSYDNYKQSNTRKDGPAPEQYSITGSDGGSWVYKNMDPIATPMKMIVNALERYDQLKTKEAQDGFVDQPAHKQVLAQIIVASGAITTAISDANLVAGFKGMQDLIKDGMDPSKQEDAILKKAGDTLGMFVPNSFHKLMKTNDPEMKNPATFAQIIQTRLGHDLLAISDVKTAYSYDALGQRRQLADVGGLWNIFSVSTVEDRVRGHSENHQLVMQEMDRLQSQVGAAFSAPKPTRPETGSLDLRTVMTADGKETLYDRWQSNYAGLNPERGLALISKSSAPSGTFENNHAASMKTTLLQSHINELQTAAFNKLLTESTVLDRYRATAIKQGRTEGGLLDFGNVNK